MDLYNISQSFSYLLNLVQRRVAEAGGRRVQAMSRWLALCAGIGGGERVQERGDMETNATDGGAVGYRVK